MIDPREDIQSLFKRERTRKVANEFEFFVSAKRRFDSADAAEAFAMQMHAEDISCQQGKKNRTEVIRQMKSGDLVPFDFMGQGAVTNFIAEEKLPAENGEEGVRTIWELNGDEPGHPYRLFENRMAQKPGDTAAMYSNSLEGRFIIPTVNYQREFRVMEVQAGLSGQRVWIKTFDVCKGKGGFMPEGQEHLALTVLETFKRL